jgi:hypothetical protein
LLGNPELNDIVLAIERLIASRRAHEPVLPPSAPTDSVHP